jgi:hypothetical protein
MLINKIDTYGETSIEKPVINLSLTLSKGEGEIQVLVVRIECLLLNYTFELK